MQNNSLLSKYNEIGNEKFVWKQINGLDSQINNKDVIEDILSVLDVTMSRVVDNLYIIKRELINGGYIFENTGNINLDYSVLEKENDEIVDYSLIASRFSPYGCLPYSIYYFYKKVKMVDFRGYFPGWNSPYLLDPLYIYSLEGFLNINESPFIIDDAMEDGYQVLFSPDQYIKEDISGEIGYGIKLNNRLLADDDITGFKMKIPFIEYLRLCLNWCGLPGLEWYNKAEIPDEIQRLITSTREKLTPI